MRTLKKAGVLRDQTKFSCLLQGIGIRGYIQNSRSAPRGRARRRLVSGEAGKEILVPYPADRMKAWPVSSRVNSPNNNDAGIIAPVELDPCRGWKVRRNCWNIAPTQDVLTIRLNY
jgi:hypothetical protein